jgi:hypothetical protein
MIEIEGIPWVSPGLMSQRDPGLVEQPLANVMCLEYDADGRANHPILEIQILRSKTIPYA